MNIYKQIIILIRIKKCRNICLYRTNYDNNIFSTILYPRE